jgi:hypothetical protein
VLAKRGGKIRAEQPLSNREFERGRKIAASRRSYGFVYTMPKVRGLDRTRSESVMR